VASNVSRAVTVATAGVITDARALAMSLLWSHVFARKIPGHGFKERQ
jgi:hypothetical protein